MQWQRNINECFGSQTYRQAKAPKSTIAILLFNNWASAAETCHIRHDVSLLSITWTLQLVKIMQTVTLDVSQTFVGGTPASLNTQNHTKYLTFVCLSRLWTSQKAFLCVLFTSVILSPRDCLVYMCFAKLKVGEKWYDRNKMIFLYDNCGMTIHIVKNFFFSFTFIFIDWLFIFNMFNTLCETNFFFQMKIIWVDTIIIQLLLYLIQFNAIWNSTLEKIWKLIFTHTFCMEWNLDIFF